MWKPQAQQNFDLKSWLRTIFFLALSDFNDDFHLETDSSDVGIRRILSQKRHYSFLLTKIMSMNAKGFHIPSGDECHHTSSR